METGITILIFAAGLLIGFIAARASTKQSGDTQLLQKKLDELKQEHNTYQESVNNHFTRTADLIDKMNRNYNDIQSHLMQGAELLVNPEYRLEATSDNLEESSAQQPTMEAAPPRDYAPKEPDQEGTLSENYGLKADDLKPEIKAN